MKPFHTIAILLPIALATVCVQADESGEEFFEKRIRPLLANHCYECHGADKQENQLRLDRASDIFAGGVSGKVVAPGKPEASLLIAAVQYATDELQMPPEGKLTKREINDLVHWVKIGAPHPNKGAATKGSVAQSASWEKRKKHWAFQQPKLIEPPAVRNSDWPRNKIDQFVLARLENAGVKPAPPASRRDLIRRATFDLHGLPPTPDEVQAFEDDDSPMAFEKVVDRLLSSPRYGERWGRRWLDVARYADSNGLDENVAHGNAWRYRDWVISSLNNDTPYDRFLAAQLAGDLLPAKSALQRNANLIATGFLSLGPKVLAEVDEKKMEMDIVDEQISTLGRAMLGITIGCARCHDHKFDPLTQKDYYALAGIFQSTHSMDSFTKIARWHENELRSEKHEHEKERHESEIAKLTDRLNEKIAAATTQLKQSLGEGAALPEKPEALFPEETKAELKQIRSELETLQKSAPSPPMAMGVREGEPANTPVHIRGSHLTLGEKQPRGVPAFIEGDFAQPKENESGRLALADWVASERNPLTARVMVNRVWRWHFGRGLAATTDNFGLQGETPTHPHLLDYLAIAFAEDWSLKNLHRRIMLSATYQTSASTGDNQLLSHGSIRRLEAEEIRDAMLSVAGVLDLQSGGPCIATPNRKHIFDHTSKDETSYANHRRSVFLPVVRNHLHEVFTLFDYTEASVSHSNRNTSTVAPQALFLLNSEFMADVSEQLRKRVTKGAHTESEFVIRLYELALSRQPTDAELARSLRFLKQVEESSTRETAWRMLCQTLLISNEFFYVP